MERLQLHRYCSGCHFIGIREEEKTALRVFLAGKEASPSEMSSIGSFPHGHRTGVATVQSILINPVWGDTRKKGSKYHNLD